MLGVKHERVHIQHRDVIPHEPDHFRFTLCQCAQRTLYFLGKRLVNESTVRIRLFLVLVLRILSLNLLSNWRASDQTS